MGLAYKYACPISQPKSRNRAAAVWLNDDVLLGAEYRDKPNNPSTQRGAYISVWLGY
jgi:hypothetical protein